MEELIFQEGDSKSFETELKKHMEPPIKFYEKELVGIRSGRATTAMVEGIKVESYGQMMPLRDLATLATPDARLITIQPWDKTLIPAIEKAILQAEFGGSPVNDGTIIRIQLPQMSEARREEIIKVLNKKTEECKINIRNVRKDFHNEVRDAHKKKIISEDFAMRLNDILQKVTDDFIKRVDLLHEKKAYEVRLV